MNNCIVQLIQDNIMHRSHINNCRMYLVGFTDTNVPKLLVNFHFPDFWVTALHCAHLFAFYQSSSPIITTWPLKKTLKQKIRRKLTNLNFFVAMHLNYQSVEWISVKKQTSMHFLNCLPQLSGHKWHLTPQTGCQSITVLPHALVQLT